MQNQKDIIIITAAGKSTWLRERIPGFGGWTRGIGEGLIGGYKEKMDILRGVDDRIYDWLSDFKQVVGQMRKAAEANRLVDVAILLHSLNSKLNHVKEVSGDIKKLEDSDLEPFDKEYEGDLPDELFSVNDEGFVSEAGMWSDFKRRWVAKHLETENRRKRTAALKSLVTYSESLANHIENYLSEMSKARASGNIGAYIDVLNKISKKQHEFKSTFMPVYTRYLAPVVNKIKQERKESLEHVNRENQERKEFVNREQKELKKLHEQPEKLPSIPALMVEKSPETLNDTNPSPTERPVSSKVPTLPYSGPATEVKSVRPSFHDSGEFPTIKVPPSSVDTIKEPVEEIGEGDLEAVSPKTLPSPRVAASTEVERIIIKQNNVRFVEEMVKAATMDDPYLLSAMLVKYAEQIEDTDLQKSLELLAIAEGIIDE